MAAELPKRRPNPNRIKIYKFSDLLGKSMEELQKNIYHSVYIDDPKIFKENFDFFERLVQLNRYNLFYSKDYDCLKFIEDNLPDYSNFELAIVDDTKNMDRSYIDLDYFQKSPIILPLVYSTWDVKASTDLNVSCYQNSENLYPVRPPGTETLSLESLKKIRKTICELGEKYQGCTDREKIILISNYLQNLVQYVNQDNISEGQKGIYITDSQGIVVDRNVHAADNVLFNYFGVCEGIANASTLLLNNPTLNVDARSVFGSNHVWNVIQLDGKYYYMDNTWNITRNPNQYPESLKASSFNSDYLLFGQDTADAIGHHISDTIIPPIEKDDYDAAALLDSQKQLTKVANFSSYNQPVFSSKLQRH